MSKNPEPAVYVIRNKINQKCYVGGSNDFKKRFMHHKKELRGQRHSNWHLQEDWLKYGEKNFDFKVVEQIDNLKILRIRENHWMKKLNVVESGYNIQPFAEGGPPKKYHSCKIPGCDGKYIASGYCNMHYRRLRRHGESAGVMHKVRKNDVAPKCLVDDCNNVNDSYGYCGKHAHYIRKYGEIREPKNILNPDRGCRYKGCKRKHQSKGMCGSHYEFERYYTSRGLPVPKRSQQTIRKRKKE